MKIEGYKIPKSSFLSIEKDLNIIIDKMLKNKRLEKMLYYTTKNSLDQPNLTEEQELSMFGKQIRIVPKLTVDGSVLNYIIIGFDNFSENIENEYFRDNIIEFDIICHFDQWQMKDFQLRPYRIAAELDSMLDNQHLTGIGLLQFVGARQMILNSEFGGICLMYQAIHGDEDKKFMPNPDDDPQFIKDFKEMNKKA